MVYLRILFHRILLSVVLIVGLLVAIKEFNEDSNQIWATATLIARLILLALIAVGVYFFTLRYERKLLVYSNITKFIKTYKSNKRPIIIGINGIDASGKTHFAIDLAKELERLKYEVCLIHIDDFHNPKLKRMEGTDERQAYISNAFNFSLLKDEILEILRSGNVLDTKLTLLDLVSDKFSNIKHYKASKETIVLIEGVLLFREPIDEYFDYRIFLDINFEKMLDRATIRDNDIMDDVRKKYLEKYIPIQKWYIEKYEVRQRSDLIIDNNNYNFPRITKTN